MSLTLQEQHAEMTKLFQAFEIAQKNDRIHLRNTYYAYAGHLESVGAVESAIERYDLSKTLRFCYGFLVRPA